MPSIEKVTSPDDPALDALCERLAALAQETDTSGSWPAEQLDVCGKAGVFEWFLPRQWGGQAWGEADIVRGYLRLAAACLTTTFVITQRTGACRRIASSENQPLMESLLPNLLSGASFATVGISHLTTSRRHLAKPVLRAEETADGFVLDGLSPWVTGGAHAHTIVTGATLEDGRQVLLAAPTATKGVKAAEPLRLVGVSASDTGPVHFERALFERKHLLAGPIHDVMSQGIGARTGGLETSTLAIGLSDAAIAFLETEAGKRDDLAPAAASLRKEHTAMETDLLAMATGAPSCSTEQLRQRANSLVLRAAQAALTAAKGAGYVLGHPAGRWCREALFFLVWSCPQPVAAAHLCELAGLGD